MGYSKKLYNVLGGVTSSIIADPLILVNTKFAQTLQYHLFVFGNFKQISKRAAHADHLRFGVYFRKPRQLL